MTKQEKEEKFKEFITIKTLLYSIYHPEAYDSYWTNGNLWLANSDIKSLPEDLYVPGSLYLTGCKNLKSLSSGLYVCGDLDLFHCENLTSIHESLYVGGYIDARGCPYLPNPLNIKYVGQGVVR